MDCRNGYKKKTTLILEFQERLRRRQSGMRHAAALPKGGFPPCDVRSKKNDVFLCFSAVFSFFSEDIMCLVFNENNDFEDIWIECD